MEKSNGNQELLKVRNEIDTIDEELLVLFIKRLECAKKVAEIKKEHSLPVLNSGREQEILNKIKEKSGDLAKFTCEIFNDIMKVSKDYQNSLISKENK